MGGWLGVEVDSCDRLDRQLGQGDLSRRQAREQILEASKRVDLVPPTTFHELSALRQVLDCASALALFGDAWSFQRGRLSARVRSGYLPIRVFVVKNSAPRGILLAAASWHSGRVNDSIHLNSEFATRNSTTQNCYDT